MRKKGLREDTIKNNANLLKALSKNADLSDPESDRGFLARLERNKDYKRNLAIAYGNFTQVHEIEWSIPGYREDSKIYSYSEKKVIMIIANSPKKLVPSSSTRS